MQWKKYDPLKKVMFQILNEKGEITDKTLLPDLSDELLLKMYKTMLLGRVADTKALQYQRQGRMLTYAPIKGQEAAQVCSVAALEKEDWMVPAFRELAGMLYKGAPLKQLFMYWYGREEGNHFSEDVKILPISVPIGSQINHAAGLAYASMIQNKKEVTLAFIGDGGTSHGEFHEGMNFAAVYNVPLIVVIQNNQFAISTPRSKQTKSETLAQKAIGYGITGILVDGNDPLAMYTVVREARKKALNGNGPTLIEAYTYRLGPHTTSDDPTIYRSDKELKEWEKKDPLKRFKIYLENKKLWNNELEEKQIKEYEEYTNKIFKEIENSKPISVDDVFKYNYLHMHKDLEEQLTDYKNYLESEGE